MKRSTPSLRGREGFIPVRVRRRKHCAPAAGL